MLAPTPCLEAGCPNQATVKGRCSQHQLPPWQGSTRKQRLPADWRLRARLVMQRDRGICHVCKQPGADAIDHIIPGDNHHPTNLAPIHQNIEPFCHRYKSSQEGNQAKRDMKTKPRH